MDETQEDYDLVSEAMWNADPSIPDAEKFIAENRPPSSQCECENTDDSVTYDFMCERCAAESDS